ncbi:MAG: hypothetical protein A2W90_08235 [Bacteroidetes bacterium GWF2_42_66]|nr:MAG: hypothetical protein A2W89_04720 [Bacteroidetes bacterium GWE2_42_39]OFY41605.1 MAG: hypothetical protein A2W90_08235 [Bacteroidetes bacterium GWF2_42_66]
MNIQINHLQHIGMPITDIVISQAFYERLGFQPVMRSTFVHEGEQGKVSMMKRDEMIIELYQMPEPELSKVIPNEYIIKSNLHNWILFVIIGL